MQKRERQAKEYREAKKKLAKKINNQNYTIEAKADEKGGEVSGEAEITGSMEIYTFTEAGIALQATISGTKYWRDKELSPRPEDKEE